ncbi:hypothetical protein [Nonomuraea sp. NPDC002799]
MFTLITSNGDRRRRRGVASQRRRAMPQCVLPDGTVIGVGSCQDCERSYSGYCQEGGLGPFKVPLPCFVRNVLVRVFSDMLLDVGSCDGLSPQVMDLLGLAGRGGSEADGDFDRLTPDLREEAAGKITAKILQLAATYPITLEFRDRVLLTCDKGRRLKEYYDRYLGHLYHAAALDLGLVAEAAATWLEVYPFAEAVVKVSTGSADDEDAQTVLSSEQHERCHDLFRRFRDSGDDSDFREIMDVIQEEFAGYEGLSASEALDRLRTS